MARRRPRRSLPGALAAALALAPVHARAVAPPSDPGALTAEGQARRDAGDAAGAIDRWQQALAALPVTQATAHRRAGLVLSIADAREDRFAATGEVRELRAALAAIDGYLAGLDPTDDENRGAVEQRRAELAARVTQVAAPARAASEDDSNAPQASDRRLWTAGGTVLGLGTLGVVILGAGLGLGVRADRELTAAVARPGGDPGREDAKAAALADGARANDAALAGGVLGGVLVVTGVALLVAAAVRDARARQGRGSRLRALGPALVWTF